MSNASFQGRVVPNAPNDAYGLSHVPAEANLTGGLQDIEVKVRRLVWERDSYADQLLRTTAACGRLKARSERRLNWSLTGWSLFIIAIIAHIVRSL